MENTTIKKKVLFKNLNKKLVISIMIFISIYVVLQIYTMSLVGTRSGEIERTRVEKNEIRLENEIIESQIDEYNSLSDLDSIISKYGLEEKIVLEVNVNPSNEIALR